MCSICYYYKTNLKSNPTAETYLTLHYLCGVLFKTPALEIHKYLNAYLLHLAQIVLQ